MINQRLLRSLCVCSKESTNVEDLHGMDVERVRVPVGCIRCNRSGYAGRLIISEYLDLRNAGLGTAILMKSDSRELYRLAIGCGMVPLVEQAAEMVRQGKTSPAEVRRVLGSGMRT